MATSEESGISAPGTMYEHTHDTKHTHTHTHTRRCSSWWTRYRQVWGELESESCAHSVTLCVTNKILRMLGVDHEGVRPDVVILGKALSGGILPVRLKLLSLSLSLSLSDCLNVLFF